MAELDKRLPLRTLLPTVPSFVFRYLSKTTHILTEALACYCYWLLGTFAFAGSQEGGCPIHAAYPELLHLG